MSSDPKLSELLPELSEETLYQLKTLLQKRARRAALRVQAGDQPGDLGALRVLQCAVDKQHDHALLLK